MSTLSDKNNNPLNIKTSSDNWQGADGSNAGFVKFNNPEYGVRAATKNLYTSQEKYGNNSVSDIVTRWAPPSDNNPTEIYIQKVADDLGVGPNDDLGSLRDNPEVTKNLIKSMAEMEGATVGKDGKYTDSVITNGVAMANGKSASEVDFVAQDTDFAGEGFVNAVDEEQGFVAAPEVKKEAAPAYSNLENIGQSNWMSTVDSPAYRWTLYVVNDRVWEDVTKLYGSDSAVTNKNEAMIIAKTGVTTEFSLDNFVTVATVTPGQQHGNTTPGIMQFDIFENLGFTFLDRVLKAGINIGKPGNLYAQNYVLKLEFIGRNPATGFSVTNPSVFFYRIKINQIRSTTGPEGTRYNVIGWSLNKHSQLEAQTSSALTVKNITTAQSFIDGLQESWNNSMIEAMPGGKDAYASGMVVPYKQVKIKFDPSTTIKNDPIPGINNFVLPIAEMGAGANTQTSGGQDGNKDDPKNKDIPIGPDTNISNYIVEYINKNCLTWVEYRKKAQELGVTYSLSVGLETTYPIVNSTMAYAYNRAPELITFTIKVSRNETTPPTDLKVHNDNFDSAAYQNAKIKRLPIEKSYSFLYSGLNTEVITYQIDIENLYFMINQPAGGLYSDANLETYAPSVPNKITSPYVEDIELGDSKSYGNTVKGTVAYVGTDEQQVSATVQSDAVQVNLASKMSKRDIDAYNFSMEIKGDPYWMGNMMVDIQGNGTLKVPDYDTRDALITFLQYQPSNNLLTTETKGPVDYVSSGVYKLNKIESRFQGGRFTQTLSGYKDPTSNIVHILNQIEKLTRS